MRCAPVEVGYHADAACVVFLPRIIKPPGLLSEDLLFHDFSAFLHSGLNLKMFV